MRLPMHQTTQLGQMILNHWQIHRPEMVAELRSQNRLEKTLEAAEEQTADLLHELVSVRKMEYQAAWEIATREWAFLPTGDHPEPKS